MKAHVPPFDSLKWISVPRAAEVADVPPQVIWNAILAGTMPSTGRGAETVVRLSEVRALEKRMNGNR